MVGITIVTLTFHEVHSVHKWQLLCCPLGSWAGWAGWANSQRHLVFWGSAASEIVELYQREAHEIDISCVLTSGRYGVCPVLPAHRPAAGPLMAITYDIP